MNENVSSGADRGEQSGAAQEAAALLRTAATALLSAAEIWSTSNVVPPEPESTMTAPLAAEAPENIETSDVTSSEAEPAHGLQPDEILAEAKFFSWHQKRDQEGQAAPKLEPANVDAVIAR